MRCRINFSPEFLKDLLEIGDYIETQLQNPVAADRTMGGIVDATDALAEYPERGARVFLPGGLDSGYRFVRFQGYLAVCRIMQNEVYVVRAVHEKQDYMRVLFPWLKTHEDADE